MGRGKGDSPIFKITRKNASGVEYFIYAFDFIYPNGQKKRFYGKTGEKKSDLNKKRVELLYAESRQSIVVPSTITTEKFLNNWLRSKVDISQTTSTTYQNYLKSYILPFIGDKIMQELTEEDLTNMLHHLLRFGGRKKSGLSPATLKKIKFMLSSAFDTAIDRDIINKNIAKKLILPKIQKPKIKPFSKTEILSLLKQAEDSDIYYGVLLGLATGLRRGELLALRWSDISVDGVITVQRQLIPVTGGIQIVENLKTNKSVRQVVVPEKVMESLRMFKNKQKKNADFSTEKVDTDLIVCQSNGKHFHPRNFAQKFEKLLKAASLEHRKIHDLRHTYATQLLTSGAYISEVQAALGHTDAKTTLNNYAHVLPGRQKELAKRMDSILPI